MSDQTGSSKSPGDLAQEILDRLVADEGFRQQLLDNPVETLAQAGYTAGDDVSGYAKSLGLVFGPSDPGPRASNMKPPASSTLPSGCDPFTTAVNCGGGGDPTTAINCGGGPPPGTSTTPAVKKANS